MTYAAAAVAAIAAIAGCTDDGTERFLFVSTAGVSAADIDASCTCDRIVFDDGACEYTTESSSGCACRPARAGTLEADRDGVVVPQNAAGYVPGDFAGAHVRLDTGADTYEVILPDRYPSPPHIVYTADSVVSWKLDRPVPVELATIGGVTSETCRVGANASPINTRYYPGSLLHVLAEEEAHEQSGVRIIMVSAADFQLPPGPPMPLPGIPTPDAKHLRAP